MTLEDLVGMLRNSIVMYGKHPVFILGITEDKYKKSGKKFSFLVHNLNTQELETIPSDDGAEFSPPGRRLGYVNIMGTCVYAVRQPVRRYKVGFSTENLKVTLIDVKINFSRDLVTAPFRELTSKSIAQAMLNKYPTFCQAIKRVKGSDFAVAFDKQFAIDHDFRIHYKNTVVGKVASDAKSVEEIVFNKGKEYLSQLLGKNYEKTIRSIKH